MQLHTSIAIFLGALGLPQAKPLVAAGKAAETTSSATIATTALNPTAHLPKGPWWQCFEDPQLGRLLEQVTANNQELKIALARHDQARSLIKIARSRLLPNLSLPMSAERQRTSENMASPFPLNGLHFVGDVYQVGAQVAWELDLSGKLSKGVALGKAQSLSAADLLHNTLLMLQAEAASHYFRLRTLDAERKLVEQSLRWRSESLNIAKARAQAGAGSELELEQSLTEISSAQAELSALALMRDNTQAALALLLGQDASRFALSARSSALPAPPSIPAKLSTELLQRRPDVSAAERQWQSAILAIGITRADFFPSLQIGGFAGLQALSFGDLFNPASALWAVGPRLTLPFTQLGFNRARMEQARANHDEALARFRQSLLTAISETHGNMRQLHHLREQAAVQIRASTSAKRAAQLAQTRYESGSSPYLEVIEANRSMLAMQRASAQIAGQRLQASVQLIKALGGGWQPLPADANAKTIEQSLPAGIRPDPLSEVRPARPSKPGWWSRLFGKKPRDP